MALSNSRKMRLCAAMFEKRAGVTEKIVSKPLRGIVETIGDVFLGRRAVRGPMKGKRLQYKGMKEVTPEQAARLREQGKEHLLKDVVSPSGHRSIQQEVYGRGGLAGTIKKHPGKSAIAGGIGLVGGNYMLKNRNMKKQMQQESNASGGKSGFAAPTQNISTGAWG